uniref:Uncharacterized protein n=1 Tax=Heterorhabditis bacteriophora TaxID=37862 RepID=A0A1I7WRG1_HETBA
MDRYSELDYMLIEIWHGVQDTTLMHLVIWPDAAIFQRSVANSAAQNFSISSRKGISIG